MVYIIVILLLISITALVVVIVKTNETRKDIKQLNRDDLIKLGGDGNEDTKVPQSILDRTITDDVIISRDLEDKRQEENKLAEEERQQLEERKRQEEKERRLQEEEKRRQEEERVHQEEEKKRQEEERRQQKEDQSHIMPDIYIKDIRKPTFLVVDDANFMRIFLKKILEEAGFTVVGEASNGAEAIELAKQQNPDVIMMDITMPDVDGIEALRQIMKFKPDTKVIMCSAIDQKDMIKEALKCGAKDFISKPFDQNKALEVIRKVVSTK